ncbi:MAG: transposase [Nitrospirae bacterium]|nr:transposase [Nitrospirota bacterium]
MDAEKISEIEKAKICPSCGLGMLRRIDKDTFQCDYSRCGKTFDRSIYSDAEMKNLSGKQPGQ